MSLVCLRAMEGAHLRDAARTCVDSFGGMTHRAHNFIARIWFDEFRHDSCIIQIVSTNRMTTKLEAYSSNHALNNV